MSFLHDWGRGTGRRRKRTLKVPLVIYELLILGESSKVFRRTIYVLSSGYKNSENVPKCPLNVTVLFPQNMDLDVN